MPTTFLSRGRVTWTNIVKPAPEDIDDLSARYPHSSPKGRSSPRTRASFDPSTTSLPGRWPTRPVRPSSWNGAPAPLLYDILIALVDYYAPLLEGAEQNIRHIEEDLFSEDTRHILNEIALARRDLIAMRRILKPQQEVIRQLARGNWPFIHQELTIYWGDIADHLAQHQAMLDEQIEVVSGLSETIDTLASHRIDEVVRVLTIITVLTLPLSLLSTIFSMNVEFPFRSYPSLFFIVIGAGVTLTADLL